ncbi:MAG: porin family protein [Bacteroidota bacterium]
MKTIYKKTFGIILFLAFGIVAHDCYAQKKVSFGLQGSPMISWMKPDVKTIENKGVKLGFGYGLILDFNFHDNYSFSTGLSVLNSNSKIQYNDTIPFERAGIQDSIPGGNSVTYKLGYLEFPLTLKLKTNEIGYITYFGQFGLSSQFRISAKGTATSNINTTEGPIDGDDISKEVRFINLALTIGAGMQYSLGGDTFLLVALLYNNGFLDVTKDDEKVVLKSLALRVGVMF